MAPQEIVKSFINDVEHLSKKDYGDFKRRVGLDIEAMENRLGDLSENSKSVINSMKTDLLYVGQKDVERGRLNILNRAQQLLQSYQ